jgi:hypothetical protein
MGLDFSECSRWRETESATACPPSAIVNRNLTLILSDRLTGSYCLTIILASLRRGDIARSPELAMAGSRRIRRQHQFEPCGRIDCFQCLIPLHLIAENYTSAAQNEQAIKSQGIRSRRYAPVQSVRDVPGPYREVYPPWAAEADFRPLIFF